jgi:hypothetical protein
MEKGEGQEEGDWRTEKGREGRNKAIETFFLYHPFSLFDICLYSHTQFF